ncbi:fimbrial protein [Enterobacteriaceae bacterium H11S18]|uniref:fimbrial protein n=1 Tax=Dryocola clanedunensis TaxID=2925396 RepID=UPI0022F085D9|nr:fimbrial protein [Dryocola clanedunensis]MCT4710926.1 fimbrial protein [Dryocola clanedunensis]
MSIRLLLLALIIVVINNAEAQCTWSARGAPLSTLTIPGDTIKVDVTAPSDTTNPIMTYNSQRQASAVWFDFCENGGLFGKSVMNLINQDTSTKIYPTNIDGIGIKVRWNNASATGDFPSQAVINFGPDDGPIGSINYPAGSYFIVEIYKTAPNLNLKDPLGDIIVPAEEIAYNWVNADSPANYGQRLEVGTLKLISTPSCVFNDTKTIDFETVTARTLTANVERDLNFAMTCRTDYGTYSANASIFTDTPSADGSYIKVNDAAGNSERMGIKIKNASDAIVKIDGSQTESISNIMSGDPANFHWKAVLFPISTTHPTSGNFTARAEILMQLN